MTKSDTTGSTATRVGKPTKQERKEATKARIDAKTSAKSTKANAKKVAKASSKTLQEPPALKPIHVKHQDIVPEGLPRKYFLKSTFNTQDIMHAPVEKTLKMLDKILAGERLFTM